MRSGLKLSAVSYKPCWLCVEQEVAKLISLSLDLGIEPVTREDVLNLIRICDYSSSNEDALLIESIIDEFLDSV